MISLRAFDNAPHTSEMHSTIASESASATSGAYPWRSIAARGGVTGAAVTVALLLTWAIPFLVPSPSEKAWGNIELFIAAAVASPVIVIVVGLVLARRLRLPRVWAVVLGGPPAGYVLYQIIGDIVGGGPLAFAELGVLVPAYAAVALLAAPLPWSRPALIRLGAVALVVAVYVGSLLFSHARFEAMAADRRATELAAKEDAIRAVGVPLVFPDIPGYTVSGAEPGVAMGGEKHLYLAVDGAQGDTYGGIQVRIRKLVPRTADCAGVRAVWGQNGLIALDGSCRQVTPDRWVFSSEDFIKVVVAYEGSLVEFDVYRGQSRLTEQVLVDARLRTTTAGELAGAAAGPLRSRLRGR